VTLAPSSGSSLAGLNLTANTVVAGDNNNNNLSNTILGIAKGTFSSNILYSISGNDLTLSNNINFMTTAATTYSLGGNITTGGTGTQTYNGSLTLTSAASLTSGNAMTLGTINSTSNNPVSLTLGGTGTVTLAGAIGSSSPLASLVSAIGTILSGGSITTTGNQTYNGAVTLASNMIFTSTANSSIAFNNGISGSGKNIVLGGSDFSFAGNTVFNNLTVNSGNTFTFNSGTLTGNITAGSGLNIFNFVNGAKISGTLDGGNSDNVNKVNYASYGSNITLRLGLPSSGNIFDNGNVYNNAGQLITAFTRIQSIVGTGANSRLIVPSGKTISIIFTNSSKTSGFINDPFYFSQMSIEGYAPPTVISSLPAQINPNSSSFIGEGSVDDSSSLTFATESVGNDMDQVILDQSVEDITLQQTLNFGCLK
jgi:hypothetical protein